MLSDDAAPASLSPAPSVSPDGATHPLAPTPPTADPGSLHHITAGPYSAEIGTRGAALRALTLAGRDLVVPQTPDLSLLAYSGRVLAPWPNRLADGEYTWDGVTYRVPINEAATNTALHGLLCWTDFTPEDVTDAAVTLAAVVDDPGYPTTLTVRVTYAIDAETGLTVRIASENTGPRSAPYGVSHHPFLTARAPVDECRLTLPAASVLRVDERLLPVSLDDVAGTFDLRAGDTFGARSVDHAFAGLPPRWEARLEGPEGAAVVMEAEDPWCQVYSGEEIGRAGVAVEPMTCPPDAFNSGEDVIVLEPGDSHVFEFRIRGEGPPQ